MAYELSNLILAEHKEEVERAAILYLGCLTNMFKAGAEEIAEAERLCRQYGRDVLLSKLPEEKVGWAEGFVSKFGEFWNTVSVFPFPTLPREADPKPEQPPEVMVTPELEPVEIPVEELGTVVTE
jgi:hypothetical protein